MSATAFQESVPASKAVDEVLSEDAYRRGVELAFVERMVGLTASQAAASLRRARVHDASALEREVLGELREFRSPVFRRLAREMEKSHPAEADFGAFGSLREPDR
jgi:hypothetical protein